MWSLAELLYEKLLATKGRWVGMYVPRGVYVGGCFALTVGACFEGLCQNAKCNGWPPVVLCYAGSFTCLHLLCTTVGDAEALLMR
jgi:hypothetical protein